MLDINNKLGFLAGVKYEDKIIFSAMDSNGLFAYDLNTCKTEYIGIFEGESISHLLYVRSFIFADEMWLVPFNAHRLACVNLCTYDISYYDIECKNADQGAYYDAVRDGDSLYLIPYCADSIIKVDMNTHKCESIFSADYLNSLWACGGYVRNGVLHIVKHDGCIGIKISLSDYTVIFEHPETKSNDFDYFSCINGNLWLMSYRNKTVCRCEFAQNGDIADLKMICDGDYSFYRGIGIGNETVFFPCGDTDKLLVYRDDDNSEVLDMVEMDDRIRDLWFEMNTIDSMDGGWISGANGLLVNLMDIRIDKYRVGLSPKVENAYLDDAAKHKALGGYFEGKLNKEKKLFCNLKGMITYLIYEND